MTHMPLIPCRKVIRFGTLEVQVGTKSREDRGIQAISGCLMIKKRLAL